MEDKILVTVNEKTITEIDLQSILESLTDDARKKVDNKEYKEKLLESMINSELIYEYGKKINIENDEKYLQALELFKKELIRKLVLQKVVGDINVTEDEIKSIYESNKEKITSQPVVTLKHILVKKEEEIRDIENQISKGLDFNEAVEKYSICQTKNRGGLLGTFELERIPNEFRKIVDKLSVGEVSQYFKTDMGYHLVKLEDKKSHVKIEFDEVKEKLKKEILNQKILLKTNKFIQKLREESVIKRN
ncbi:peptidylprolyl isomerase [Clostridium sp. Marseille-Q2269]|uniref:peptidylprolyl isomerase n=1 Tax=Clostridium sp. Marseille-Q2269 TaxID=2942205 RepID=UPI002072F705|nr:peptidylprolyl isomerase [Clostridium sp. Marseille-Q2269]